MLKRIQQRLSTLDAVLNEQWLGMAIESDARRGFDPAREYAEDELRRMFVVSPQGLMKTGQDSKYMLFEIKLEQDESVVWQKYYLRGFDYMSASHPALADRLLVHELGFISKHFPELPERWQSVGEPPFREAAGSVTASNHGITITITGIGGGKFDLRDRIITTKDESRDFGSIPPQYKYKLAELLGLLVQKPTYHGFQINFG